MKITKLDYGAKNRKDFFVLRNVLIINGRCCVGKRRERQDVVKAMLLQRNMIAFTV